MKAKKTQTAPGNSTASPQLLSLISSFFAEFGFESTNKAFKKELRQKDHNGAVSPLDGAQAGAKLQVIVENWIKNENSQDPSDGAESESDATTSDSESASSSAVSDENEESSIDTSESEEEVSIKQTKKSRGETGRKRARSSSESRSSSSSDSEADDENEDKKATSLKHTSPPKHDPQVTKPINGAIKPNLKRKAGASSSESSSSSSDSDCESDPPAKRTRLTNEPAADATSSSDVSSSDSEEASSDADTSSSEEEQDSESDAMEDTANQTKLAAGAEATSDSSGTVVGDGLETAAYSSQAEDSAMDEGEPMAKPSKPLPVKKQHVGARPTPLAQLSSQATADSHISNAYRSYDYAERAYQDLSVTRGKGFTKEKNKKKRGSYRGGAIDISGGRGFKFED